MNLPAGRAVEEMGSRLAQDWVEHASIRMAPRWAEAAEGPLNWPAGPRRPVKSGGMRVESSTDQDQPITLFPPIRLNSGAEIRQLCRGQQEFTF